MKIKRITITNFLGIEALTLEPRAPISLIVGENEAGKSSIRDAIQWCFTGQARGLKTHQDQAALIREGAKAAEVEIETADGQVFGRRKTPKSPATMTGNATGGAMINLTPAILCDPYHFLNLEEGDRRELLFRWLPGLNPTDADVAEALAKAMYDEPLTPDDQKVINRLASLAVKEGFPAAEKEAVAMRREAKRLREAYGQAQAPEERVAIGEREYILPDVKPEAVKKALADLQKERDAVVRSQGEHRAQDARLEAAQEEHAKIVANFPPPPPEGELSALQDQALAEKKTLADLEAELAAANGPPEQKYPDLCPAIHGTEAPCPLAGTTVVISLETSLNADPAKLEKLLGHIEMQREEVAGVLEKLKDATARDKVYAAAVQERDRLQAEIDRLQEALAKVTPQEGDLDAMDARLANGRALLAAVETYWRERLGYETATEQLAQAEAEITLYDTMAKALAPDGIPSRLIAAALDPFNSVLKAISVNLFPGRTLELSQDLQVRLSGCPFTTLSKSARFRVGIAFQIALARLAGDRLLLIDEADILDPLNRAQLIEVLLDVLQEFDTIMVFATAPEARPSPLPEVEVFWLEAGRLAQVSDMAAG